MKSQNNEKGKLGEELAAKALKRKKYKIIEKNFRCKFGEIDIVAKDKDFLVFVEVKLRQNTEFGLPREAVDIFKQRTIIKCAQLYLLKNKITDVSIRFDVVEVLGNEVTVIQDAFRCD